jgi:hypothetical protein
MTDTNLVALRSSAERVLVPALAHPHQLPCVVLILGHLDFVNPLVSADPDAAEEGGTGDQPEFNLLRAAIARWLTAPRTLPQLRKHLSSSCSCPQPGMGHLVGGRAVFDSEYHHPFPILLEALLRIYWRSILAAVLKQPKNIRFDQHANRILWPTHLEQMLPHGPEDSMRGLLSWLRLDLGSHIARDIVHSVEVILRGSGALTLPSVITSDLLIPRGVITIIEYSCQIMDTNLQRVIRTMPAQDLALNALWGVSCLWNTIVHRCDVVERKRLTREPYASQLLSIFDRCIRSIRASTANRERETVDFFSRQAWKILEDFPHLMNPRLSPQVWAKRHENAGLDDYRMIEAILSSVSAKLCASPECTRTFSDRWPLRWCAGCRRVTYCSRRCQKTAWAHEVVGH